MASRHLAFHHQGKKMSITSSLNTLRSEFENLNKQIAEKSERNIVQMKVLATVKCNLENLFKRQADQAGTIIECIDLLRTVTPHYSTSQEKTIIDPPLTDEEKNKIKELFETVQK